MRSDKLPSMAGKRASKSRSPRWKRFATSPRKCGFDGAAQGLAHRNNFIVAKAADLVREFSLQNLAPELLSGLRSILRKSGEDRSAMLGQKCDQPRARRHGISGGRSFLRGMRHIQMEPVWGGRSDTAGTLRAICALALCNAAA